jgi:hypothetical protein
VIADGLGDGNSANRGDTLQACRHVHAIAENVAIFDDDISEIDADAKFDGRSRLRGIACAHGLIGYRPRKRRRSLRWEIQSAFHRR